MVGPLANQNVEGAYMGADEYTERCVEENRGMFSATIYLMGDNREIKF